MNRNRNPHRPAAQPRIAETYFTASPSHRREQIAALKEKLGDRLLILAHNYQADDVYEHGDLTGDSLGLSRLAAEQDNPNLKYIVFCGVHFMAETADILRPRSVDRAVILPETSAGCPMAEMADANQARTAWERITSANGGKKLIPITYVNSTAAVKAFVGQHDGACCTSGNAERVLKWALSHGDQILFLPDQHLGRNTAVSMGYSLDDIAMWRRMRADGGLTDDAIRNATFILWDGFCCVHQNFSTADVQRVRADDPDITVVVHPECKYPVAQAADMLGSTSKIIQLIEAAEPGEHWAIGTEDHLVARLAKEHAPRGVTIRSLAAKAPHCDTMGLIDAPHLWWTLDNLAAGDIVNRITVDEDIADQARIALDRMLNL